MILQTYQSLTVFSILKRGERYRAKPSLSFKKEYAALIDMLGLQCDCPIFAVVKGRKQNTGGRVSGAVLFTLNVPDSEIKFTEYSVWADFLYAFRFSKPNDYRKLKPDCEEMTHRHFSHIIASLSKQKPVGKYSFPQAILEEIRPEWLVSSRIMPPGAGKGVLNLVEKLANTFRK